MIPLSQPNTCANSQPSAIDQSAVRLRNGFPPAELQSMFHRSVGLKEIFPPSVRGEACVRDMIHPIRVKQIKLAGMLAIKSELRYTRSLCARKMEVHNRKIYFISGDTREADIGIRIRSQWREGWLQMIPFIQENVFNILHNTRVNLNRRNKKSIHSLLIFRKKIIHLAISLASSNLQPKSTPHKSGADISRDPHVHQGTIARRSFEINNRFPSSLYLMKSCKFAIAIATAPFPLVLLGRRARLRSAFSFADSVHFSIANFIAPFHRCLLSRRDPEDGQSATFSTYTLAHTKNPLKINASGGEARYFTPPHTTIQ